MEGDEIRLECLKLAFQSKGAGTGPSQVIEAAKTFEEYVSGKPPASQNAVLPLQGKGRK